MKFNPSLTTSVCLWLLLSSTVTSAATDSTLPQQVEINGVALLLIPAGWFTYTLSNEQQFQGLPDDIPVYRQLRIWLDAFYMAKYEATAQDLARFMNSSAASTALKQSHVRFWSHGGEAEQRTGVGCTLKQNDQGHFAPVSPERKLPATYLSWNQADAFSRWMGFRLPSDAEWQKAAQGPDARIWPWGDAYPDDTYALFGFGRKCTPTDVDTYPKGRSPYGLFNMTGNVSEHVADAYNYAFDSRLKDGDRNPISIPQVTEASRPLRHRIRHGGSWSSDPHSYTNGYRRYNRPNQASNRYGVRFAVDSAMVSSLLTQGKATTTKHDQSN